MDVKNLRYDENHTWVRQDGEEFVIGISDYAQDQLGDIIFAELPEEGTEVSVGDPFATLESAKAVQDLTAPISGTVTRCNEDLLDAPETINEDPYGAGWMIAVKAESDAAASLMTYQEYSDMLEREEE